MGGTLSSEAAHRILVGMETLELRLQRSSDTALALARHLAAHPAIAAVHYPMLESHPEHPRARDWFGSGSWMMAFELRDAARLNEVINRLRLPLKATGLADTRTLIIPVAPTIFWEMGAARIWVHTNSLDGPAALPGYQARGFRIFKEERLRRDFPDESPGPWPGAGRVKRAEAPEGGGI